MLLQLLICLSWLTLTSAAATGCQEKCGDFNIPYPFGIGEQNCYKPGLDFLVCNESFSPPRLLYGNIPVVDISLDGAMTVNLGVSYHCYDKFGVTNYSEWGTTLSSLFTFSDTRNKFTAIGCDTNAIMSDSSVAIFKSGCMSVCANERSVVEGSCSGIGCCQTAIPKGLKTLNDRLRIAAETAGAIAYLHSASSTPVIHRDVKSSNILLDGSLIAKVADFGASRLVPLDRTHVSTLVQGTLGYLDPEYFHSSQLTEKSDVYSFGVVLVELLTGKKPLCPERSQDDRNLATYFITLLKENRFFQLLESQIMNDGKERVVACTELAKRCLNLRGEERPTMKEVAMELEGLRRFERHPWELQKNEERTSLISESQDLYSVELTSYTGNASGQYSMGIMSMSIPPR
ncbi:hypothetical protein GIB67_033789 [Kingdonia uniflora]|uniref:Protein kinase domain-containing protein n=1 Tax=Kingdonia uniflora TaxID=39325 RepID=A0A7J7P479_9MAGN|nr:hypothetical protein GIB67_033789 [Kingdonia uniflora]